MSKKSSVFSSIAIMSIFFIIMGVGTVTPALNNIHNAFPNLPLSTIYLVTTLPSLLLIPATLVSGMMAGNKVKYKTLASIGTLLFAIAGVAPAFTGNFTIILIERALFGIGVGFLSPLGNAIVIGMYDGDKRAKMLGIGTVMMNIGRVVLQLLGGALAATSWNFVFYPHAFGILALILIIFFLPEPEKIQLPEGAEKPKVKISSSVWLIALLFGLVMWTNVSVMIGMSSFLARNNLGNSATTAIVLSWITVGGIVSGALFSTIYKLVKRFVFAVSLMLMAIGMAIVLYSGSLTLIMAGTFIIGFAFSLFMPSLFMVVGMVSSPQAVPISSSILMASSNIFVFAFTYWSAFLGNILGDPVVSPIFVGLIMAIAGGVLFLFINPFPKKINTTSQDLH